MQLNASYSNVPAPTYAKRFTAAETIRYMGADFFTLASVLVIGIGFLFTPWMVKGLPGINYMFDSLPKVSQGVLPHLVLIALAALTGIFATLWGLLDFNAGRKPAYAIFAAGILGMVAYAVALIQYNQAVFDLSKQAGPGFWITLVGLLGLMLQIFIPRPAFQISLQSREAIIAYLFLTPFLLFFLVFVVRSVVTAFQMSFYDWAVLKPTHPWLGMGNYEELFKDYVWWDSLKNTVVFALLTVTGTTVVSLLAAVAVTQPIKGAGCFRVLLYMPTLLSVGVVGLTWGWLLNTQFGIINYALSFIGIKPINWLGDPGLVIPALSLTTIWWGFGFPMLIFIAGLQGIPDHLYEAARIDGANGRQIFLYITVPLLRPTILFVTVTGVISHFQVFGQPFIISNGGPGRSSWTVIFYLYQMAWGQSFRLGYGAAIAMTLAVIMGVATAIQFFFVGRQQAEY